MIAMAIATQAQNGVYIEINPAPEAYEMKVTHNESKPEITLSGSEKGVTYQLYRRGDKKGEQIPVGKPVKGTGNPLTLIPDMVGVFSTTATSTKGCCSYMANVIAVNPQDFQKVPAVLPNVSPNIAFSNAISLKLEPKELVMAYNNGFHPQVKDENTSILKASDWIVIVLFLAIFLIVLYGIKNRLSRKTNYVTGEYREIKPTLHIRIFNW
jgi:hypothetical protein